MAYMLRKSCDLVIKTFNASVNNIYRGKALAHLKAFAYLSGPTNPCSTAVHMEPFNSTSTFIDLIWIFVYILLNIEIEFIAGARLYFHVILTRLEHETNSREENAGRFQIR